MMSYLPEFATQAGKDAFVNNHPIGNIEKADWKANVPKEAKWQAYIDSYTTSLAKIDEVNKSLVELDKLIFSHEFCTEGGLSLDDIDLWSRLRSLSLVKGVVWPTKLGKYMKHLALQGDLPLLDSLAC